MTDQPPTAPRRVYVCENCFTISRDDGPCGKCRDLVMVYIDKDAYDALLTDYVAAMAVVDIKAAKLEQTEREFRKATHTMRRIVEAACRWASDDSDSSAAADLMNAVTKWEKDNGR